MPSAVAVPPTPTVLVVSEARGFVHDSIPAAQRALVGSGDELGVRVRLLGAGRELTAVRLRGAAAVVLLDTTGDVPLGPGGRARLLRYVRRGGGLVGLRAATNGFPGWPAFGGLIGARFVRHQPLAWRRREGRGRVFVSTLGHPDAAWASGDPRLALVRSGLRWAAPADRAGGRPPGA